MMACKHLKAAVGLSVLLAILLAATGTGFAQRAEQAGPRNFQSRNFLLHTDLPPAEANELLKKLERMLKLISTYWGRPCSGTLECYVVRNLANWPPGSLPPEPAAKIANGEGITMTRTLSQGDKFIAKSIVFVCDKPGVVQHESVHAYCGQTFGRSGPIWYAEGMAEMGQYFYRNDCSIQIEPGVLKYLQNTQPQTLATIVNPNLYTGDSWQNYAWRWVLCHMLANNPNYAARFQPLGIGLLTEQNVSFQQTYGDVANEISFEYLFFIAHMCQGFRVDLCAWDWSKKFTPMASAKRAMMIRLLAKKGWQPTGLAVKQGHEYSIKASGNWKPNKKNAVNGDGTADGTGGVAGVLMKDWQLGKPFMLGSDGTFVAPAAGNLYLRCNEPWSELADNSGMLSVKFRFVQAGDQPASPPYKPLPKENSTKPAPKERTWTDATGKFTVVATFVGVAEGKVRLRRSNGTVVAIPLSALRKADQDYVRLLQ